MIEKECASEIHGLALKAISDLARASDASRGRCSAEEYERIRRGVGLSIGAIQTGLLDVICKAYPELDDLR